jgi:hypothetical protein
MVKVNFTGESKTYVTMPQTLNYRPVLFDSLISNDRIGSYQTVFQPANDVELMGVYLWNAHVCSAIYPLLGLLEVSLRNSIDRVLTQALGQYWWTGNRLNCKSRMRGAPTPAPLTSIQSNFRKATSKLVSDQQRRLNISRGHVTVTHGGVIAKAEFSTWEFILDDEFSDRGLIWPQHLGKVFRGPWPSTSATTVLNHARHLVNTLRDFRNRLFHHEPAWKRFGVMTEADAIQHLDEKLASLVELLTLIHPEIVNLLQKNGLLQATKRACTSAEIRRFQHAAQAHTIASIEDIAALANQCGIDNRVIHAILNDQPRTPFLMTPKH